jgi:hypothetical protein
MYLTRSKKFNIFVIALCIFLACYVLWNYFRDPALVAEILPDPLFGSDAHEVKIPNYYYEVAFMCNYFDGF